MSEARDECRSVREELALRAMDALEPGAAAAVEEHLQRCVDCAAEARELAAVRAGLDAWDTPSDAAPASALARGAFEHAQRRRRRRWAAAAAAGLLALGALAGFGAGQRLADRGRALGELVDARAEELVAQRMTVFAQEQEARLAELDRRLRSEREELVAALERLRAADRVAVAEELALVARGAAAESRETRAALIDLAAYVARREGP